MRQNGENVEAATGSPRVSFKLRGNPRTTCGSTGHPSTRSMKKDPPTGERGMSSTARTATGSPRVSYIPH